MKIEYANSFSCESNAITGELMLVFNADYNTYDTENKPHPQRDEVSRILISAFTADLLIKALTTASQQTTEAQQSQVNKS